MKKWENLIDFFNQINKLKQTYRYGGEQVDFKESSADHSWRLALLVIMFAEMTEMKIDKVYAIKLALIHDLAESVVGDINVIKLVSGEVSHEDRFQEENKAWQEFEKFLSKEVHQEFYEMWLDFENQNSSEAKFVVALDRIEGALHIMNVGCAKHSTPSYMPNACDCYLKQVPELREFLEVIKARQKQEFERSNLPWEESYEKFLD